MIRKYNHVIWDWNGTIINDVDLCVNIVNGVLKRRKLPNLTLEKYKSIFTIPVKDYYIKAGFDFTKESFEILGKEWMDEYEQRKFECNLYDDLTKVMGAISDYGLEQSILSAYMQDNLVAMIKYFKLEKYFSHIVGLDNIYAGGKLELGKNLIRKLGNGKSNALIIGDTIHDYEVAKEIGADCVLIANGHQSFERLQQTGSKVTKSLSEFYDLYFNGKD